MTMKTYLVKVDDSLGKREAIFHANSTKEARKQARKKLNVVGNCEYNFKLLKQ